VYANHEVIFIDLQGVIASENPGNVSPGHLPALYKNRSVSFFESYCPERKRNSMTDSEQNNEPISEPLKTPREKTVLPHLITPLSLGIETSDIIFSKVSMIKLSEISISQNWNHALNVVTTFYHSCRGFTRLRCGHIFHRLCAEKKLLLLFQTHVHFLIVERMWTP